MEASSLDVPSEERNEYISPFKTIFAAVFNEEMVDQLLTVFSTFEGGKFKESGKHLKEIFPDLVDVERVENMSHELGMEEVLCHGDLWSMNVLWRQKGDALNMAAVVDYQTAHFGCAATDLVR
ncbi:hypothetical protein COOONC_18897, partial [Cooperia oncophora]